MAKTIQASYEVVSHVPNCRRPKTSCFGAQGNDVPTGKIDFSSICVSDGLYFVMLPHNAMEIRILNCRKTSGREMFWQITHAAIVPCCDMPCGVELESVMEKQLQ